MEFKRESVAAVWDELIPLAYAHHKEMGLKWPFDPKRGVYEACERAGFLYVFTMREAGVTLSGYQAFNVVEHPHMAMRVAQQDTIYVKPEYRGYSAGRFMAWADKRLAEIGVDRITRIQPHGKRETLPPGYTEGDRMINLEVSNG